MKLEKLAYIGRPGTYLQRQMEKLVQITLLKKKISKLLTK
jgi:hypothetical protein